jgi:CheY-like chemotaxis protein
MRGRGEVPEPAVLLVEDDAGDAMLVGELLADSGVKARLRWARSLGEARRALIEETPQCVLLDLNLPKYDGRQVLQKIKSDPDLATTPVVVLTRQASPPPVTADISNASVTCPNGSRTRTVSY